MIKWTSIRPLDHFSRNLTQKSYYLEKTKSNDRFRFCPNVTFEDDEFKDNKALNDQGKDEGTKKMEDYLKKKWKTNQSTKIILIGCDTIVNSPSVILLFLFMRLSNKYQLNVSLKPH